MEQLKKINNIYTLLGAIIIGIASYATISAGGPEIYAPFSLSVALPAILLWYPLGYQFSFFQFLGWPVACSFIPVIFIFWTRKLYINEGKVPWRSVIFFPIMMLLSIVFLATSWEYGLKYQGKIHTLAMYGCNLLFWVMMIFLYLINRKKQKFIFNFFFHLVSFIWLAWVAFPWLGELL